MVQKFDAQLSVTADFVANEQLHRILDQAADGTLSGKDIRPHFIPVVLENAVLLKRYQRPRARHTRENGCPGVLNLWAADFSWENDFA